jgi:hypothetical protein
MPSERVTSAPLEWFILLSVSADENGGKTVVLELLK